MNLVEVSVYQQSTIFARKNNPVINVTNKRKRGEEKGNSPNRIRNSSHRAKINRRENKIYYLVKFFRIFTRFIVNPGSIIFNKKYVKLFFGVETQYKRNKYFLL